MIFFFRILNLERSQPVNKRPKLLGSLGNKILYYLCFLRREGRELNYYTEFPKIKKLRNHLRIIS